MTFIRDFTNYFGRAESWLGTNPVSSTKQPEYTSTKHLDSRCEVVQILPSPDIDITQT